MIGVVVPAKDEEETLGACLDSIVRASAHPALGGEPVLVVVVLDGCTDDSELLARNAAVTALVVDVANVGAARAHGARFVFDAGARWLACTDADSVVEEEWLAAQLAAQLAEGADVVCGTVAIADVSLLAPEVALRFGAHYQDRDGHRHIHGANLGVSREAYATIGGFMPIVAHEDVALVRAAEAAGLRVAWSARPRVITSTRLCGRAPEGFAASLRAQHEAIGHPLG